MKNPDNMSNIFISSDKQLTVKLYRSKYTNYFTLTESIPIRYNCRLVFSNILGNIIADITVNEHDIYRLLDNFYIQCNYDQDVFVYFNSNNSNCIDTVLGLRKCINIPIFEMKFDENDYYEFSIYNYNSISEQMIKIISVKFTAMDLINFSETLYSTFVEDIDDLDISEYRDYSLNYS